MFFHFTIFRIKKQLQSLAQVQSALTDIKNIENVVSETEQLINIGKSYTTETLKAAIAQSTLDKQQIKTILSSNNLQDEILETTTNELANIVSTNMTSKSQKNASDSTHNLEEAFVGLGIEIKTATLSMLKFLFTNPIGWATLAVGAIAGVVYGVKQYRDNIIKSAEESENAIIGISNTYRNLRSSVADTKQRYAELAQGVDQFTGTNLSLSNEEYSEFLSLSNQLADVFPSLSKKYDAYGNIILNLAGDVNTIIDSLNSLVETEKLLSGQQIIEELPRVLSGHSLSHSDMEKELNALKTWQHDLEIAYESLQDTGKIYETGFLGNNSGYLETIHALSELDIAYKTIDYEEGFGFGTINLEDHAGSINKIYNALENTTIKISNINSKIKAENAEFNRYLSTWLFQNWAYASIDDTKLQYVIQEMLFNTDWLLQANKEGIDTSNWDQVSEWIEKKYISAIANVNDENIKSALANLYSMPRKEQALSKYVENIKSSLKSIEEYCENNNVQIPIDISSNTYVETYKKLADSIRQITDDHGISDRDEYSKLNDYTKDFTLKQTEYWLEFTYGAENASQAIDMYEAKMANIKPLAFSSALSSEPLSTFQSTIDSLKSSLTTLYNGDYSSSELISALTSINSAMADIGKSESINWEEITNVDDLDGIIDQITNDYVDTMLDSLGMAGTGFGDTIRNVIQEELKASRQLETYKNNVSDLQSAYSSLTDVIETYNANSYITFDQLTALLEMEPQYLSCLIDVNGQLQLNEQAMADLAQLRLNEAKAQVVQQAITELNRLSEEKQTQAVKNNSTAYADNESAIRHWNNSLYTAMQNAGLAVPLFAQLSSALGGAVSDGVSDEDINQVLDNAYKQFKLIDDLESSLGSNLGNVLGKTSPSSSSTDDFKEQFDFFERRVKVLDNAVSLLRANLENLTGSFAKNQLLDQNSNLLEERVRNYSDAAKMYQQKAQESLAKLDLETQSKIINGSVSLQDYIGEDSKAVTQAMNDYQGWADKVADCTEELASLQTQLRQLELDKFNHIVQDFTDQFDLRDNTKGLIDKQIALFEEAGQLVGKAFYEQQISQTQKQLSLLETEKAQLVNQLNTALASGRIQKGTEEWLEMVKALSDVDGNILDCKKSIETFDNAIQNLHWETFDRVQDTFGNLSDEISNLLGTMKDAEVATPDNQWTAEGLTQLGLYAQQYELATYQASQYADEIDRLNADYLAGKYSATEYADKLADLSSSQWKAVNAAESAKDSILDLNETRVSIVTDGIRKEIDAYKELIDSQTEALDTGKELHEYQNSIAEKSGNIAKMEKQLAAMQNDTTAAAVAKRKQLEEQLAQVKADLEETQYQHSVETQKESLNQQYENYETARNQEIESLEESLKDKETIIAVSMESVKQNTQIIASQITEIANQHGIKVSTALTNSWASGENAIASYGEVLSQQTSTFIGNIMAVETQIYQLQTDADITALSLANMFGATADNLVGQLNASYFAETNLLNMTNALQNSLVNTLQGEYNVSNIVNSLNAVTNAAQKAKEALRSTLQPISQPARPDKTTKSLPGMAAAVAAGNTGTLKKYASGTRNITSNQLALTNESGQEFIYRTEDGSILTRLQPGDKVFSNAAVERLWNIGQGILPQDILKGPAMPPVLPNNINNQSPVNIHYDSMLTFTGDVNDTNHFTKQVRAVAKEVMTDTIKLAEKTRKYGMF